VADVALGYAVVDGFGVNVRSVSASAVGAMVNWLIDDCKVVPMDIWLDSRVEEKFREWAAPRGARVARVSIEEVAP
jgi:hypothetical protein